MPGLDPGAGRELVEYGWVHRGVGVEGELLDALVAGEAGVVDAAGGAASVAVEARKAAGLGGLDELVDELEARVADSVAGLGRGGAKADQQV